jgi:hypothetical protein
MYTKFRVHLIVGEKLDQVLHGHLAATKSSSYLPTITLYCCQNLRRNIAPARLKEIAQLAE